MITELDRNQLQLMIANIEAIRERMTDPVRVHVSMAIDVLTQILEKPKRHTASQVAMMTLAKSAITKALELIDKPFLTIIHERNMATIIANPETEQI